MNKIKCFTTVFFIFFGLVLFAAGSAFSATEAEEKAKCEAL
jgi:hypothetical protein